MTIRRTVVALFDGTQQAINVIKEIDSRGLANNQVSLITLLGRLDDMETASEVSAAGVDVMPQCLDCGNGTLFAASMIPSGAPWADGPVSGLVANFSQGEVPLLENMGASHDIAREAFARPEAYFDTCQNCGSHNVVWL